MSNLEETQNNSQISFKTRVKNEVIGNAGIYYSCFVCRDYLVLSPAFHRKPYYEISAHKGNYLHLTGVSTHLSAESFFDKCLNGTLTEDDFTLGGASRDGKTAKGAIRDKIRALPSMPSIISAGCLVEEDFKKNRISCSFASSDGAITMGFISLQRAFPMTLLRGDELDHSKAADAKVILSKSQDAELYSSILVGTVHDLVGAYDAIKNKVSDELRSSISALIQADNAKDAGDSPE